MPWALGFIGVLPVVLREAHYYSKKTTEKKSTAPPPPTTQQPESKQLHKGEGNGKVHWDRSAAKPDLQQLTVLNFCSRDSCAPDGIPHEEKRSGPEACWPEMLP